MRHFIPKPIPAICITDGCERKSFGRGLCGRHWRQWRRTATPDQLRKNSNRPASLREAFERYPTERQPNGCLEWRGSTLPEGYGTFPYEGRTMYSHRVAWELANGPVPEGWEVDHICLNARCVEPAHLRPCPHKQNAEHRNGAYSNNKSTGVRGVYVDKRNGRFIARVKHNYKDINVGRFATLEEAAEAARLKRLELFTHNDLDRM